MAAISSKNWHKSFSKKSRKNDCSAFFFGQRLCQKVRFDESENE